MRAAQKYTMQKIRQTIIRPLVLEGELEPKPRRIFNLLCSLTQLLCFLSTSEATFSTQPRGIPIVSAKKEEGVDER